MAFGDRYNDLATTEHLTSFAQAYGNTLSKEIDLLAPVIPTQDLKFEYGLWSKKAGFQNPGMTLRAPGTVAKEFTSEYSAVTDKILGYAGRMKVPRQDQKSYPGPLSLIEVKTQQLTRIAFDDRRKHFASLIASSGLTYTAASTGRWDTAGVTTQFDDINTGVNSVLDNAGKAPNTIFMSRKVARALRHCSTFVSRYSGWTDTVQKGGLPEYIDDMKVVILEGITDANNRGASTASLSSFYEDSCWIAYIEPTPDPFSLTAFSTFRPVYAMDVQMDAYYEQAIKSDWIEYEFLEEIKLVSQDCIYAISNCLA